MTCSRHHATNGDCALWSVEYRTKCKGWVGGKLCAYGAKTLNECKRSSGKAGSVSDVADEGTHARISCYSAHL